MSELLSLFQGKTDFNNELFYYFLPNFNSDKKQIIGQKISKFHGVKIINNIYYNIVNKLFFERKYKYINRKKREYKR